MQAVGWVLWDVGCENYNGSVELEKERLRKK
jgi:hypothetical protein